MQFKVRYYDPGQAAVLERLAQAESLQAVQAQLAGEGLVFVGAEAQPSGPARTPLLGGGAGAFNVAWWCRELRTLLQAGMTVVEALETLQAQSSQGARGDIQSKLLRALREGRPLSKAMHESQAFPPVLVASVKASERTSTLGSALADFLAHDEMMGALRKQVVSAAIYPAVVVTLGLLITLFLLLYVIPRFSGMYVDFHGNLSLPTQVLLGFSKAVSQHTAEVAAGLAALVVGGVWWVRSGGAMRFAVAVGSRIGPLQRQWDHFRLAKLYQSLALMFRGGYTLDEAMALCETLGLGARMSEAVARARIDLARGKRVSATLSQAGLTDTVAERLLAVGERTGSFDVVLQTISQRHAAAFTTFVERATRLVEPVLLLMVALLVGGIVVMMYMPIFDIANGVR